MAPNHPGRAAIASRFSGIARAAARPRRVGHTSQKLRSFPGRTHHDGTTPSLAPMRLRSLTRLLEVARAVAEPRRIVIIGSASLLPAHPELGDTGQPLDGSYDADFLLEPMDE